MKRLLLMSALALPSANFTRPTIVSYQAASNEEERLREWLKKKGEAEDVFITPKGQADKLREAGYERLPFKWKDLEVWILRKPKTDSPKKLQECA